MSSKDKSTNDLYANPSFLEGVARILDFGNALSTYNESKNGKEADSKALNSDWSVIGQDIRDATARFGKEHQK